MINALAAFPRWMKTDLVIERSGGRDRFANPTPGTTIHVFGCVVDTAPPVTETADFRDASESLMSVLAPGGSGIRSTDTVEIMDGLWRGRYSVDGRPTPTPLGVEVRLRRST